MGKTIEALLILKETYEKDWIHIIYLEKNYGPSYARNIGWDYSTNEYIAFLDSDDSWHPKKIEIQFSWMDNNKDVILTGHSFSMKKENEAENEISMPHDFKRIHPRKHLMSNRNFATPSLMLRRDVSERFPINKRYSEDVLFLLQLNLKGNKLFSSNQSLAYIYKYPFGASGLSSHLWRMEIGELDTLKQLCNEKLINKFTLIVVTSLSIAKFFKRLLVVFLRRIKK